MDWPWQSVTPTVSEFDNMIIFLPHLGKVEPSQKLPRFHWKISRFWILFSFHLLQAVFFWDFFRLFWLQKRLYVTAELLLHETFASEFH